METNVGGLDRIFRSMAGPALIALGYTMRKNRDRRTMGMLTLLGGAVITGTALTKFCPINLGLGIDTAH